jgi:predicted protein tyrosine phosphatase
MQRILFICSRNRLRSPTAEFIFRGYEGIEVTSAGLAPDAEEPLSLDHLDGVDIIFVMERSHHQKLTKQFAPFLKHIRVICLNIPDDYDFMQPELIRLLTDRVTPHLKPLQKPSVSYHS